ncbi:MAG: type II secretion system protein [Bacilli bacterium]|nr:type II secretion system protein [Bacilli bacterium]
MKKINYKGFTLIELLAVITIMGILMLVAIPAVSRIVENARCDTFMNTAKAYINATKNAVAANEIYCGSSGISAREGNYYYIMFDSSSPTGKDLIEQGGKSSWGNADVKGIIIIKKTVEADRQDYHYYIIMADSAGHGIGEARSSISRVIGEEDLDRDSVKTLDGLKTYYNNNPRPTTSVRIGYEKDDAGNDIIIGGTGAVECHL